MITRLLGPNWRTTITGWLTVLASGIVLDPSLLDVLPPACRADLLGIAKIIALLSGGAFATLTKDKAVSGIGTHDDPHRSPNEEGTRSVLK